VSERALYGKRSFFFGKIDLEETRLGLVAIYRQEILQAVTLFTSRSAAGFYEKLFSCLDFTLPRAPIFCERFGYEKSSLFEFQKGS
jgi:hypothetical protein